MMKEGGDGVKKILQRLQTKTKGVTNYALFGIILLILALLIVAFFYFAGSSIIKEWLTKMLLLK